MTKALAGVQVDLCRAHLKDALACMPTALTPEEWEALSVYLWRASQAAMSVARELREA